MAFEQQGLGWDPQSRKKGMNSRKFLISVGIALVLLFVVFFAFIGIRQHRIMHGILHPRPTSSATPE